MNIVKFNTIGVELRRQWKGRPMGQATPVILSVATPVFRQVVIEASDGYRYVADLSRFSTVECYPKDAREWQNVFIDSDALSLVWSCRFEVHIDQILANVIRKELPASSGVSAAP